MSATVGPTCKASIPVIDMPEHRVLARVPVDWRASDNTAAKGHCSLKTPVRVLYEQSAPDAESAVLAFAILLYGYVNQPVIDLACWIDGDTPLACIARQRGFLRFILRVDDDADTHLAQMTAWQPAVDQRPTNSAPLPTAFEYVRIFDCYDRADGQLVGQAADLTLRIEDYRDRVEITMEADPTRYELATLEWLLDRYTDLAHAIVSRPKVSIQRLICDTAPRTSSALWNLLGPEGHRLLPPPAPGEAVIDRFRQVARANGDQLAITDGSVALRYAELEAISTALADRIPALPSMTHRFGLLTHHDLWTVVSILAILRAGAAYVPLDARHPDGRLKQIVSDASLTGIVADTSMATRARLIGGSLPVIEVPISKPYPGPLLGLPNGKVAHEALAYLLYTSGSTGRPKGVVQNQANVLSHALRYANRLRLGPTDHISLMARATFDAAVMDIFGALVSGAALQIFDPIRLSEATTRDRIVSGPTTVLHCTPTLFRLMAADFQRHSVRPEALTRIRAVVLGGEEVVGADVSLFRQVFPASTALVNGFGPTECTIALQHLVSPEDAQRHSVPIGFPVEGIRIELIDSAGRPTPHFGEMVIYCDQVALGYWNREDLTRAAFYVAADGSRAYRTGDLARRRHDGSLIFCGRNDRQVKIRGHRVELGETESVLLAHPTVAQAAVVLHEERLVGFVSSASAIPIDVQQLRGYLERSIPEPGIPSQLVALEDFPIGVTGKVDRSRLIPPSPILTPAEESAPTLEPLVRHLCKIWRDILRVERIGLSDNFIDLGGDSLQILELLCRIQDELDTNISLQEFIMSPTLQYLSKQISAATPSADSA